MYMECRDGIKQSWYCKLVLSKMESTKNYVSTNVAKRKRSPNWIPSEKKILPELVEKHFAIIENKKNRCCDNEAKECRMGKAGPML